MKAQSVFIKSIVPREIVMGDKTRRIRLEKVPKGKIKIFYRAVRGAGPKPFIFPEKIVLNKSLGEAIGLYVGDGKTTNLDRLHSDFVNKDQDLNLFMLKFFTLLGARLDDITFKINYRYGNEEEVRTVWANALGIPREKLNIKRSNRYKSSTLRIQVNGIIFRLVLGSLILEVMKHLRKNKMLRRAFLRGIFAAEGSIAIRDNYINYISISYNPSTERSIRDIYRDLLFMEGVKTVIKERRGNRGDVIVSNWNNYLRLWEIGIFDLCKRKSERFSQILKRIKICCVFENNFLMDMLNSLSMTQREIADLINTYQASVSHMSRGSFLLQIEQIYKISQKLDDERFSLEKIRNHIKAVRMGPNTYLNNPEDFLDMLFELRIKN